MGSQSKIKLEKFMKKALFAAGFYLVVTLMPHFSYAQNVSSNSDIYYIENVATSMAAKTPLQAKAAATNVARRDAFLILLTRLSLDIQIANAISDEEISDMIKSEHIASEKMTENSYSANLNITFAKDFVNHILSKKKQEGQQDEVLKSTVFENNFATTDFSKGVLQAAQPTQTPQSAQILQPTQATKVDAQVINDVMFDAKTDSSNVTSNIAEAKSSIVIQPTVDLFANKLVVVMDSAPIILKTKVEVKGKKKSAKHSKVHLEQTKTTTSGFDKILKAKIATKITSKLIPYNGSDIKEFYSGNKEMAQLQFSDIENSLVYNATNSVFVVVFDVTSNANKVMAQVYYVAKNETRIVKIEVDNTAQFSYEDLLDQLANKVMLYIANIFDEERQANLNILKIEVPIASLRQWLETRDQIMSNKLVVAIKTDAVSYDRAIITIKSEGEVSDLMKSFAKVGLTLERKGSDYILTVAKQR